MGRAVRQRIVGLGVAVTVLLVCVGGGALATLLVGTVRSRSAAATHVAVVRGEFASLVSMREAIEAGDDLSVREVDLAIERTVRDLNQVAGEVAAVDGDTAERLVDGVTEYTAILAQSVRSPDLVAARANNLHADAVAREAMKAFRIGLDNMESRSMTAFQRSLIGIWISVVVVVVAALVALEGVGRATRRAQLAESGRRSDDRMRALIEHAPDVVMVVSADGASVRYASPAVTTVLGFAIAEFSAMPLESFVHPDDRDALGEAFLATLDGPDNFRRIEVKARHASGAWRHLDVSLSNRVADPDIGGVVVNARDISERVDLERSLSHQASHDPLTGLANRAAFVDLVHRELCTATVAEPVAIVFLDLDGFKEINDTLGHGAGDEVLMTVAARLVTLTRHRDYVARLGGDEFALACVGDEPGPIAERLLNVITQPIELGAGSVQIGASVGIASATAAMTVDELLRDADVAMYDAKARGKNRVSRFEPEMHDTIVERVALRAAIDRGLEQGQFRLVYQPEIALGDGRLLGFEALLRWHLDDGTIVPPNDFIPLTESTGQIVALGRWVLGAALAQLVTWQREFSAPNLTMAVNVSARQLTERDFVPTVVAALAASGADPRTLTLELTESTLVGDLGQANQCFSELRALGVRLAVDDYGAGHASIGYLRDFPIDILKIDRSFVWALDTEPQEAQAYLRSITELAAALKIDTVAEGIEHPHQLESLRALGCTFGQGYHLARPLDVDRANAYLTEWAGDADRPAHSIDRRANAQDNEDNAAS